jgi:hypothetical protein
MQHPGQGNLRRRGVFQARIRVQKVNNGLISGNVGAAELGYPIPNIVVSLELCLCGNLPGQQAAGDG